MKRILAAVDFSDVTADILAVAGRLARKLDAEMELLHTESPPASALGYGVDAQLMSTSIESLGLAKQAEEDKKALAALKEQLADAGVEATSTQVEGPTIQTILREAERYSADLIVVGSHEHGALHNLFFGSVQEGLIQKSHIPVLVVPLGAGRPENANHEG